MREFNDSIFSEELIDFFLSPQLTLPWGEEDSNLRSRTTTDLQSAPVGHFGISPYSEPMEGFEPPTS